MAQDPNAEQYLLDAIRPYDLSAERGYLEIARPPEQREMPLNALRVRDQGEELYEAWKKVASEA